jgi:hypothetical protein
LVAAETADEAKTLALAELGSSRYVVPCEEVDLASTKAGVAKRAMYEE